MTSKAHTKHLQQFSDSIAADVRRGFGEIQQAQPAPAKAQQLATALTRALVGQLEATLNKTPYPVTVMPAEATEGWMIGLADRRNLAHGRSVGVFCCLMQDGKAVYAAFLDVLAGTIAWAAPGEGCHFGRRLRVSGREQLTDGLILLPWRTKDILLTQLMQKAADATLHTRKTGQPVQDALALAAGQADVLVNMGLPPAELHTMALMMQEAGALVTDTQGQPVTLEGTTLLAANPKLHPAALKVFANAQT